VQDFKKEVGRWPPTSRASSMRAPGTAASSPAPCPYPRTQAIAAPLGPGATGAFTQPEFDQHIALIVSAAETLTEIVQPGAGALPEQAQRIKAWKSRQTASFTGSPSSCGRPSSRRSTTV
jgi:hypothetical protein